MSKENKRRPLRSLVAEKFSFILFKNNTGRKVDIFWLDYTGHKVKYGTLRPGDQRRQTTYVSHPWIFRDSNTFDVLVANKKHRVFFPEAFDGQTDKETVITIDTPGYFHIHVFLNICQVFCA